MVEDSEEVPLLERQRHKLLKRYHALTRQNEVADAVTPCDSGNSRQTLQQHKIDYAWNNLNVYGPSRDSRIHTNFQNWWNGTRCNLGERRHILKNMRGLARSGEILAIMGPSGAGKSTLLNSLTLQTKNQVTGSRFINGCLIQSRSTLASLSAFVEQNTLFIEALTVREHLIFHALIRMDRSLSYSSKLKRVDDVILQLNLEKCKNTVIGGLEKFKGISSGEMKRLSFASEILTNPPLMFCDEPTSSLDSLAALNVTKILKAMALEGKTVICTVHQPSSDMFSLFDKILLVTEGRTAFFGSPSEAATFFAELGVPQLVHHNLSDILMGLLSNVRKEEGTSGETINFVCDSFDQSSYSFQLENCIKSKNHEWLQGSFYLLTSNPTVLNECSGFKATWLAQFRALFWRSWLILIKQPLLLKVRLFQAVVLSLVVGLIYHNQKMNENGVVNINGVLFTFITNMTFQNLFAVITVFCSELPVFMKEHDKKMYRVDVYFLSKTLAETPLFLLIPSIFTLITYYWIGLNPGLHNFFNAILVMVLITNVATSFGYFISCVCPNVFMALSIGPPFLIPLLLFGGYLLNSRAIPSYFKWISYLSWFKYGYEALFINQWSNIDKIDCIKLNTTCPKNGDIIMEMFNFQKEDFNWNLISLVYLILLFRLFGFLALVIRTKLRHWV